MIVLAMPQVGGRADFEVTEFKGISPIWVAWWMWKPPMRDAWQTRWFEVEEAT